MTVVAEGLAADEFSNPSGGAAHPSAMSSATSAAAGPTHHTWMEEGMHMTGYSGTAEGGISEAKLRVPAEHAAQTRNATGSAVAPGNNEEVLYRGSIEGLPEAHASRKERFSELDSLQPGWQVELRNKGATIDAVFFSPSGDKVGAFANARRMALAAHKALPAHP